ncbi:hypothetical protein AOQ84DRAFT_388320 [Glonium stellatum]|uniref:BRCT domain-containing protein n=1 Tax=Glonium stellatum TaxID=574774 RepID=A0A8E2JTN6_9PEZI|nr:hypothetical protein AOQ84DRAFT_388320 [Glonium stellatum]
MKNPLSKYTIVATGDFGSHSYGDMKRWVENNGGTWATSVTARTTHLICSKEHWKKKAPLVKAAQRDPDIKIVTFDWLEDSLLKSTHKREKPYMWKTIEKARLKEKKEIRAKERKQAKHDVAKFGRGCKSAMSDLQSGTSKARSKPTSTSWFSSSLDALQRARAERATADAPAPPMPTQKSSSISHQQAQSDFHTAPGADEPTDLYHIYMDSTGFEYDITLTRIDLTNNRNERYHLRLYESHTEPHTYCTHIRLSKPSELPKTQLLVPLASPFSTAFRGFCNVFRKRTLLLWDERFERRLAMSRKLPGQEPYVYLPPPAGEPRGVLPEMALTKPHGDNGVCEDFI